METIDSGQVEVLARSQGFALAGVAGLVQGQPNQREAYIRDWLAEGRHGQMAYLENNLDLRLDPTKVLPEARSIICVADRHPTATSDLETGRQVASGRIARYAWGDDYHRVMKKRLFAVADALRERYPGHAFRVAVDTAPVLERDHAQRAGMGWVGKHTLLIHREMGSWIMLGEILTTLPLDDPSSSRDADDHCGTCTRCIDACPTDCITPYQLDASRCISYLTIEHRGVIDPSMHGAMGDWVAGCDICQEVCPYNKPREDEAVAAYHPRYEPRPPAPAISLMELLGWDAEARQEAFRGSALKRIKLDMLKRNALIAAGNYLSAHEDTQLHGRIAELAESEDEPELVRQTARQVLDQIGVSR